ncbi:MAG: hypothetical protein H6604_09280 [Flavobacteriales bacterium]|nr:hypothetical protein [Flavobacteriales bacterium]
MEREHLLNTIRNRPRFNFETSYSVEKVYRKLRKHLDLQNEIGGYVRSYEAIFRVRETKHEYWSPIFSIRAEYDEERGVTEIRGVLGPKSSVWLLFVFSYFGFGTFFMISGMFMLVSTSESSGFYMDYLFWISLLGLITTYVLARVGRIKAKKESETLKKFVITMFEQDGFVKE